MSAKDYHVLIVDDNPEDRAIYARRMSAAHHSLSESRQHSGYVFLETDNGEAGLEMCRNKSVDCVLLDYNLPDLDGLQFMSRLNAEQGPETVAVVMLTGQGNEQIAVQALKQGAQDYLVKGRITGEEMHRAVHAAIDKIALHKQIEEQRRELERRAGALRESEQRYRLLLREVHHRVKNNLQVISSLLNLQSGYVQNPQASGMFRETQQRVRCMAAIHEALYCSENLAQIDFAAYMRSLGADLVRLYEGHSRSFVLQAHNAVVLDMDAAIPCGLILHELIANCFKHAYAAGAAGQVQVEVSEAAGRIALSVRDFGAGLPESVNPQMASSLGLRLVRALTKQLGGAIDFARESPGTLARLTFSKRHITG